MKATNQKRKPKRNPEAPKALASRISREIDAISAANIVWRRRLTTTGTLVSTSGGVMNPWAPTSSGVTSATDWATESGNFGRYRVIAMKATCYPVFTVPFYDSTANFIVRSAPNVVTCVFTGNDTVGSYGAALQGTNARHSSGYRPVTAAVDAVMMPNAKLWTAVGQTIGTDNVIGIAVAFPSGYYANSTTYFAFILEYVVEFMMME